MNSNASFVVSIPSYEEKIVENKSVYFYNIDMIDTYNKSKWRVCKRYSEFKELYNILVKYYSNCPTLPKSTTFLQFITTDTPEKCKERLEGFLVELIGRQDIFNSEIMQNFLEIKGKVEKNIYTYHKVADILNFPFAVKDFIYLKNEQIVIVALKEDDILKRIDRFCVNFINLPWDKGEFKQIATGALLVGKMIVDFKNTTFNTLWCHPMINKASYVCYNEIKRVIYLGQETGALRCFYLKENIEEKTFLQAPEYKTHGDRITGISFDNLNSLIITCSFDGKILVSNILNPNHPIHMEETSNKLTCMYHDKRNSRLFVGNEIGYLSVYSLELAKGLTLLTSLNCENESQITSLELNYMNEYIYLGFSSGETSVLDLEKPGKERFIKKISKIEVGRSVKAIVYINNNQLVTGDDKGFIGIWNLKTGEAIHIISAHYQGITKLSWDEEKRYLFSSSKDKSLKIFQIPERWKSKDLEIYEINESKIDKDLTAMIKLQNYYSENLDDSDNVDEDINGWDNKLFT